jgi:hypothetical protein
VWEKSVFPLSCFYAKSAAKYQSDIGSSIAFINRNIEANLIAPCFPWVEGPAPMRPFRSGVIIHFDDPPDKLVKSTKVFSPGRGRGGSTFLHWNSTNNYLYGAVVFINPQIIDTIEFKKYIRRVLFYVITHELLHVLGLAHDRISDSIMNPVVTYTDRSITSKDIRLLREVYVR